MSIPLEMLEELESRFLLNKQNNETLQEILITIIQTLTISPD